ncbi:MAG: hypothetical protein ACI3T9_05035 [Romboutsia timonensis]
MKIRVNIKFKNHCAVSFKCEKDNADAVVQIMLKELKKSMDDVDMIKFTDLEE